MASPCCRKLLGNGSYNQPTESGSVKLIILMVFVCLVFLGIGWGKELLMITTHEETFYGKLIIEPKDN